MSSPAGLKKHRVLRVVLRWVVIFIVFIGLLRICFPGLLMLSPTEETRCLWCQENLSGIFSAAESETAHPPFAAQGFLDKLLADQLDKSIFRCPSVRDTDHVCDYQFAIDNELWQDSEIPPLPLGWDSRPRHSGCRNVLFQGGQVRKLKEKAFQIQLERLHSRSIPLWPRGE